MNRIDKECIFGDQLEMRLTGDISLLITEKGDAGERIEIEHNNDFIELSVSESLIEVIDSAKKGFDKTDFPRFTSSIEKKESIASILIGFAQDALDIKKEQLDRKSAGAKITLHLSSNARRSLNIKADNLNLNCSDLEIERLSITSGNLKIKQDGTFSAKEILLSSANMKGAIHYTESSRNIILSAGNGRIEVFRGAGFSGAFDISGNNIKVTGLPPLENKHEGLCKIYINNGKIKIIER